jgi:hypothetical protein
MSCFWGFEPTTSFDNRDKTKKNRCHLQGSMLGSLFYGAFDRHSEKINWRFSPSCAFIAVFLVKIANFGENFYELMTFIPDCRV